MEIHRRDFLRFLGHGAMTAATLSPLSAIYSCATAELKRPRTLAGFCDKLTSIRPSARDEIGLSPELRASILIQSLASINARGESFGYNPDYIAIIPDATAADEYYLWVNHEYVDPLFVSGVTSARGKKREFAHVERERHLVGGSVLKIKKTRAGFQVLENHAKNRRLTGHSAIPFSGGASIGGEKQAIGTVGNCGGGVTPWGSFLTCEENYSEFFGERAYVGKKPGEIITNDCLFGWESVWSPPPEHYGWVVEVNPRTGDAKKLVSLGRFSHESATVAVAADGRCVVYSGDDANDRCLYKFIADQPGSLEAGTLYVANLSAGKWIPLSLAKNPALRAHFNDQQDVLIRARWAAMLAGGTPLDRPEDIDIDPISGSVFVTLTNNTGKLNSFGSILKIMEKGNDPRALEFESAPYLKGGPETGFACPDNLLFDTSGNLWFTSDMSASVMNSGEYLPFKNNGLFLVQRSGTQAGKVRQIASAPVGAEFTGPCLSPDGSTLFLSVQHPGEGSLVREKPASQWPRGGLPLPAVVMINLNGAFS